jgi:hypothetical protein
VDVHELAGVDVLGVVDSARSDVAHITLIEEYPISIGDERVRFTAIELSRHSSLHDHRHVVARV